MSKRLVSRVADIIYSVATLVFFIVMIIAFIKLNNSDFNYIQGMGMNWNKGPIISVNAAGDTCQNGEVNLITDKWPGTLAGCHCSPNLDILMGPLREGRCRKKRDSAFFCSTVQPKPEIPYRSWRGKNLCAKRIETSYLDLTIASNAKSCPMNTQPCGIIDSLNNVMCAPSQSYCPINHFQVIGANDVTPSDRNYTVINANGKKLLFSNADTDKGKILNDFVISEDLPCANPGYKNYISAPYLLDAFYRKHNCDDLIGTFKYDDSYIKGDTYSSYNVYNDNNILPILYNLPEYPDPRTNSSDLNLYYRNYIGLSPSCLARVQSAGTAGALLTDLVAVEDTINVSLILSIAAMIITIILFIIVFIYCILVLCTNSEDQSMTPNLKLCLLIFPYVLNLAAFILSCILISFMTNYSADHAIFAEEDCVDPITFAATSNFYSSISSAKFLSQIGVTCGGLLVFLPIVEFILVVFVV